MIQTLATYWVLEGEAHAVVIVLLPNVEYVPALQTVDTKNAEAAEEQVPNRVLLPSAVEDPAAQTVVAY